MLNRTVRGPGSITVSAVALASASWIAAATHAAKHYPELVHRSNTARCRDRGHIDAGP